MILALSVDGPHDGILSKFGTAETFTTGFAVREKILGLKQLELSERLEPLERFDEA